MEQFEELFFSSLSTYKYSIMNPVTVLIGNKKQTLVYQDFIEIRLVVDLDNITDTNWKQLSRLVYNDQQLLALNIFIYYIINIAYSIDIPDLQALYIQKLTSFYFQNNFNIQISKFSKFCAKILELPYDYCFHLCYFLIYGRLVSDSYIATIKKCAILPKNNQHSFSKKIKSIAQLDLSNKASTNQIKKKTTIRLQNIEKTEYQKFADELQEIFKKSDKQKHLYSLKNQRNNTENNPIINKIWEGAPSERKHYLGYFPTRTGNTQKSAIVQSAYPTCRQNRKKVRKLKFNPDEVSYKRQVAKMYGKPIQNEKQNQWQCFKSDSLANYKQTMKCNPKDIHLLNHSFKEKSEQLDAIRKKLKETHKPKKPNQILLNNPRFLNASNQYESVEEKLYIQMKKKASQNLDSDVGNRTENRIDLSQDDDYQENNNFKEISKKLNPKQIPIIEDEEQGQQNMKRIEEIGNLHHKKRLYYYRSQYRSFMKTHILNVFNK